MRPAGFAYFLALEFHSRVFTTINIDRFTPMWGTINRKISVFSPSFFGHMGVKGLRVSHMLANATIYYLLLGMMVLYINMKSLTINSSKILRIYFLAITVLSYNGKKSLTIDSELKNGSI